MKMHAINLLILMVAFIMLMWGLTIDHKSAYKVCEATHSAATCLHILR